MQYFSLLAAFLSIAIHSARAATHYSATYLPYNAPEHSETGQTGTNQCGSTSSQTSMCQNVYVSGLDDFCLWAPPTTKSPYGNSAIGNTEAIEVSWCLRSGYGTRLIPPAAIQAAHFVQTPEYVQITGYGDLTQLNIPKGDEGGELDPHGYTGLGNPIGGLVFGTSFNGTLRQYHEWTNFMSASQFCIRACIDGPNAPHTCNHIYDTMGCEWNMPGDYGPGFTSCEGDSDLPMGIYGTTTFHQGDPTTPAAHPAAATSNCQTFGAFTANLAVTTPAASLLPGSVSASLITAKSLSLTSTDLVLTSGTLSSHSTPSQTSSSVATSSTAAAKSAGMATVDASNWIFEASVLLGALAGVFVAL